MKRKIIFGVFFAVIVSILGVVTFMDKQTENLPETAKETVAAKTNAKIKETVVTSKAYANPTDSQTAYASIPGKIQSTLNDGTQYAVYVLYPQKVKTPYIYNSKPMRSASMIKVFILAAVMAEDNAGRLSIDETMTIKASDKVGGSGILAGYATGHKLPMREVLRLMITESDNTATNMIIDRVGFNAINNYIKSKGFKDTILRRKMMDMAAIRAGRENMSSVTDLGEIFRQIYVFGCVSEKHDHLMLDYLFGQTDTDCFPAALPGAAIAHKTGALNGLYDDGGIIYRNGKDTILVIMTENCSGVGTAMSRMRAFTKAVTL